MANKRGTAEVSDIAYKKLPVAKARAAYRRYGNKIRVSRSDYEIIICDHLFYHGRECEGLCDSTNKIIYVTLDEKDLENMDATFVHEFLHAAMSESTVTLLMNWDSTMEEVMVESLSRDLLAGFELKRRKKTTKSGKM